MIRDSIPLRHGNGALFRAARAFCMLTRRDSLALTDLCPGPVPPIKFLSLRARLEVLLWAKCGPFALHKMQKPRRRGLASFRFHPFPVRLEYSAKVIVYHRVN